MESVLSEWKHRIFLKNQNRLYIENTLNWFLLTLSDSVTFQDLYNTHANIWGHITNQYCKLKISKQTTCFYQTCAAFSPQNGYTHHRNTGIVFPGVQNLHWGLLKLCFSGTAPLPHPHTYTHTPVSLPHWHTHSTFNELTTWPNVLKSKKVGNLYCCVKTCQTNKIFNSNEEVGKVTHFNSWVLQESEKWILSVQAWFWTRASTQGWNT